MAIYKRLRFLLMAIDPVHIGTGGYRLGRVDNSIVREPGTRLPKIPGTSLHGAARSYAAQLYGTPEASGQKQDQVADPGSNPVCYTFGYTKKTRGDSDEGGYEAYSGVVNIFDAHVLLFPVHSMYGPVWVTTRERMEEAGFSFKDSTSLEKGHALTSFERSDPLNLGWLIVEVQGKFELAEVPDGWKDEKRWGAVRERLVVVHEALFTHVVNSNLEVRTSVAIDPDRGAAEDRALFTYEALPRATFLTVEVVLDDYREGSGKRPFPTAKTAKGNPVNWKGPLDVVSAGLGLAEWLGVGGMGTRGFGRIAVVGKPWEQEFGKEA